MKAFGVIALLAAALLAGCQSEGIPQTGSARPQDLAPQNFITRGATADLPAGPAASPPARQTEPARAAVSPNRPPPSTSANEPVEAVIAAMLALHDLDSYRVEQSLSAPDTDQTSLIEIIPPDRFRLVNPEMEMIVVAGEAFIKVEGEDGTGGEYLRTPGSGETIISSYAFLRSAEEVEQFRQSALNARLEGMEEIDRHPVTHYAYDFSSPEEGLSSHEMWVGADGLPRRLEMRFDGEEGESLVVNVYLDFNAPITIEPPE